MRRRLLASNPFAFLKAGRQDNPSRLRFVTLEETERLLAACPPNTEWPLIIALARYGGLRIPSEALRLRWGDIDWEDGRMIVQSPKTEAHEGHGSRIVPLFPELKPYLERAFDRAPEGAEYVVTKSRDSGVNWRTTLEKIIGRAGLVPWERPFQNLRASKETELAQAYPLHTASAWIGNSALVAAKHYLTVREEDYRRAATVPMGEPVQNPVQQSAETACTGWQAKRENPRFAEDCDTLRHPAKGGIRLAGIEPATYGLGNRRSIH